MVFSSTGDWPYEASAGNRDGGCDGVSVKYLAAERNLVDMPRASSTNSDMPKMIIRLRHPIIHLSQTIIRLWQTMSHFSASKKGAALGHAMELCLMA